MAKEIERKFLLVNDAWRQQVSSSERMTQAYIANDENASVRIRICGEHKAQINIKSFTYGISRYEYEYDIPITDAIEMLETVAIKPFIDKTRYYVPQDGLVWEIDEFYQENEGLIVAEIELPTEDALFEKPEWIGDEVTDDPRYLNVLLIKHPFCEWN